MATNAASVRRYERPPVRVVCSGCNSVFMRSRQQANRNAKLGLRSYCTVVCANTRRGGVVQTPLPEYRAKSLSEAAVDCIELNTAPDLNSSCWLWLGPLNRQGYAKACVQGRRMAGHRAAWLGRHGVLPPDGLCLCHRCDTPTCVNPDHLFVGTTADNVADRVAKKRSHGGLNAPGGRAKRWLQ